MDYLRIKPVRYCLPGFLSFLDYCGCIAFFSDYMLNFFIMLHQQLLFSGREVRSTTVVHLPIRDSVIDPVVYLRMP